MSTARDSSAAPVAPLRYTMPSVEGTVWLGLRPGALVALAVTVSLAVGLLMVGTPVPIAVLLLMLGAATATVPISGRTALAWLPVLLQHHTGRLTGTHRWAAPLRVSRPGNVDANAAATAAANASDGPVISRERLQLPPEYGHLDLLHLTDAPGRTWQTSDLGILHDPAARSVTVVLDVQGMDRFALLTPGAQDSQLARWGTCLSALAADPDLLRMQWLTQTRTDTRDHSSPRPSRHRPESGGAVGDPELADLQADYDDMAATVGRAALSHTHLLALTLRADVTPGRVRVRGRGGSRQNSRNQDASAGAGAQGSWGTWCSGVTERVRDLATTLLTADLLPRPLTASEVSDALRQLLNPDHPDTPSSDRAGADALPTVDGTDLSQPPAAPPSSPAIAPSLPSSLLTALPLLNRKSAWDHCRTEDTWHRTYALTGWPRLALPADWLAPILHATPPDGTSRTLAIHTWPVAPQHAARRARASRAKAQLDAADRSRMGFTSHAGDTLAETDALELESELIAGYRLMEIAALITVSAPDPERLQAASTALRTLAVSNRLDLRPLHGQHTRAWSAASHSASPCPEAADEHPSAPLPGPGISSSISSGDG